MLLSKFEKAELSFANEFQNMAVVGILSTQILHHQFVEEFRGCDVAPVIPDKIIRKLGGHAARQGDGLTGRRDE